ncbi:Macrophage-expressed 1 protein [Dissostichus eleginoides]|uniref:Macrophage-expressed 1 protein n=1 Tax=Dissostichus eleginoides TaxID=100907 RepID=A0AAD9C0W6_DISEL|nr:Macrophage-expressed 1 protein [Dissostichus eleginoides]
MVLDYGTHVITSVDAGATLVQEDYLSSSYMSGNLSESSSVKAQAGLNFFDKLKFDISSQNTQQSSSLQTYQSNIQYSLIQSHGGGTPFYPGITLQKWQESTRNNLVAIDRSGFPLHYFINTNTFPDLPQPTVGKVAIAVSQAVERYYMVNTRPGCVDVNSKNFNFQANIDDASCEGPATNLRFGGVYQKCVNVSSDAGPLCDALAHKNPDTGDFSCRSPYTATLLRSEVRQQGYKTYDCYDQSYSSKSVPFGGLFSCQSYNPLAGGQRRCPPKFSQHLASVSDGCEILYCVQSGLFTGGELLPVRLPPFTKPPLVSMQETNTVMVMTEGEKSWVRAGQTKAWKLANTEEIKEFVQKLNPEFNQVSSGEKAWIAFGVIGGLLLLLGTLAVVLVKRRSRY